MDLSGSTWILGEERDGTIHPVSYELLAWGRGLADALGKPLVCVILGADVLKQAPELVSYGADCVLAAENPALGTFRLDPYARVLGRWVKQHEPDILLAAATTMGRTLMPILAARLGTGLTADCTGLDIDPDDRLLVQTRPAIGGNVMALIKTPRHRPQMATVRPKSKRPLLRNPDRKGDIVECQVNPTDLNSRVARIGFEPDLTAEAPIQDADVVVAGGNGLRTPKRFAAVFDTATALGGAVGASRVAVDRGWTTYAHQVGLSGKSVTPRLYIALGISGSPNHLAGMASSERIVAINKDPEAAIFKVADFGIIGDLSEIMPHLLGRLRDRGGRDG